jgi:hypothetical protein
MPDLASRKDIIKLLTDSYSIYYAEDATKNELSDKIKLNNPKFKTFGFDRILAQQKHIQCLPPYHLELNTTTKNLVYRKKLDRCKNVTFKLQDMEELAHNIFLFNNGRTMCQCTHM